MTELFHFWSQARQGLTYWTCEHINLHHCCCACVKLWPSLWSLCLESLVATCTHATIPFKTLVGSGMVCGGASHNDHPHPCYKLKSKELQVNVKLLFPLPFHKKVCKVLAIVWAKPNFPLLPLEFVGKVGGWPPLFQTFKLALKKCYFHVVWEPRLDPNHMPKVEYFFEGLKKIIQMEYISSIIWTTSYFQCSIIVFVHLSFTLFSHKVNPFVCMLSCVILLVLMVLGIDLVEHNIGCDRIIEQ